ncbi:MAG TPA: NAD(P)/FAD-dependent oxidoreductase [Acidimicrobiales bacterium]|nr:NAD(P)/FAD-dependent oxidoreductase [Acidimicrobiales bacterium]
MDPRREPCHVVVVGAGPAGAAAAITLARLGLRVAMVDKATFPRDKCCGDGLTTAALRRLESLGLDPADVGSWEPVGDVVVVGSDGRQAELPLPDDGTQFAASARRVDLDAALVQVAVSSGAALLEGVAVTGVSPAHAGGAIGVNLADGSSLTCAYLIAADGAWSPVRKAVGAGTSGYLGDWQAGRQYYAGAGPAAKKLWVWFEPEMVPGYAWSFPLAGGMVNVGYGVLRDGDGKLGGELKGQQIDFLDRPHIAAVLGPDAAPASGWKAWPIPARIGDAAMSALDGRVLFAGDAARACDPMTGEGIAQALETGELAARAVAAAGPRNPAAAARRYERQVRWGMSLDDKLARALSNVLARRSGSSRALAIADKSAWSRRNFARWMFEDYPRAVLATPHRWSSGMFTRPGAYRA